MSGLYHERMDLVDKNYRLKFSGHANGNSERVLPLRMTIAFALLVGLTGCASTTTTGSDSSGTASSVEPGNSVSQGIGSQDASADVTNPVLGATDALGFRAVTVTVTNNSSKRSGYLIDISVESPDGATQYDTTIVTVSNLEPGQSTNSDSIPITKEIPADAVPVVKSVSRLASSGGIGSQDASADVTNPVLGATDALGFRAVTVTATNNSSERSNYLIEVSIESPDGATQYDTTIVAVSNLEPGQTANSDALPITKEVPADAVAVVKSVSRLAAN